ncbi:sensor histidine kinase [Taibaiella koreensis]|uniref:sensor histidine kinase n=1 Tax=Taibaiella koreensis TaxID=1268548 RepID=UPI0013C32027|nr:histidine kinase [Taibaiella koreensis]
MTKIYAQTTPYIHYGVEQGLPSDVVYSALSDSKGYLWVATDKGLCRYNGYDFTLYTTQDGLPDNEVFSCWEDPEHRLWISTFKGLLCYLKDGVFHTAANTHWLRQGNGIYNSFPCLQHDGSLILKSGSGRNFIEIKDSTLRQFSIPLLPGCTDISLIGLKKESENLYCLFYPGYRLSVDSSMRILEQNPFLLNCCYNRNSLLFSDTDGIYSDQGVLLLRSRLSRSPMMFPNNPLFRISPEAYWIAEDKALRLNDKILLRTKAAINFIERDTAGHYWVATGGDGLYKLNNTPVSMQTATGQYNGKVVCARVLSGKLFFITDTRDILTLTGAHVQPLSHIPTRVLESNRTYWNGLRITDEGALLLHSILYFHLSTGMKPPYRHFKAPEDVVLAGVKTIFEAGNDLYFFSSRTLTKFHKKDLPNQPLRYLKIFTAGLDDRIFAKAMDRDRKQIWFSSTTGVFKVRNDTALRQRRFPALPFRQFECFGPYLAGITDDSKLILCNTDTEHYPWDSSRNQRCLWEHIYPIDREHAILSTNKDYRILYLYPPDASGRPRFSLRVLENPFVPLKADLIVADTNYCYFFKSGTVTTIKTTVLFAPAPQPLVHFTSFRSARRTYNAGPGIILPYTEAHHINISIDPIVYTGAEIHFQYSLTSDGKDEWLPLAGREINLNDPGFGSYTLKVRAQTLSSSYSKATVLHFIILKPYWAAWWFITLCSITFIALVWLTIHFVSWIKIRRKQRQHEADMKYQQSEYKALNALMNPHFIFNSLNNIQGLINKDEKRIANEYLVIFSDLIRQNMHNVSKGFISLQQELNLIENYLTLEKLRFKDLIHYEMLIDEEVDAEDIMIPPLMIQPLVENAVKHGLLPRQSTDSKVTVTVYEKVNKLYVEITDNGIGITQSLESQSHLHESFGLSNLKKRTEHLKKIQQRDIDIEVSEQKDGSGRVTGTRALITIVLDGL